MPTNTAQKKVTNMSKTATKPPKNTTKPQTVVTKPQKKVNIPQKTAKSNNNVGQEVLPPALYTPNRHLIQEIRGLAMFYKRCHEKDIRWEHKGVIQEDNSTLWTARVIVDHPNTEDWVAWDLKAKDNSQFGYHRVVSKLALKMQKSVKTKFDTWGVGYKK